MTLQNLNRQEEEEEEEEEKEKKDETEDQTAVQHEPQCSPASSIDRAQESRPITTTELITPPPANLEL